MAEAAVVAPAQYEFSDAHEVEIEALVRPMLTAGGLWYGQAALSAVMAVLALASMLPVSVKLGLLLLAGLQGVYCVMTATWVHGAARNLQQIVESSGTDLDFLMEGLSGLRRYFRLVFCLTALVILVPVSASLMGSVATATSGEDAAARVPESVRALLPPPLAKASELKVDVRNAGEQRMSKSEALLALLSFIKSDASGVMTLTTPDGERMTVRHQGETFTFDWGQRRLGPALRDHILGD